MFVSKVKDTMALHQLTLEGNKMNGTCKKYDSVKPVFHFVRKHHYPKGKTMIEEKSQSILNYVMNIMSTNQSLKSFSPMTDHHS